MMASRKWSRSLELFDHLGHEIARLPAIERNAAEPAQEPAHRPDEGGVLHDKVHIHAQRGHGESGHEKVAVGRVGRAHKDEARQVGRVAHHTPAEEAHEEGKKRARQPVAAPGNAAAQCRQFRLLDVSGGSESRLHAELAPAAYDGRRSGEMRSTHPN
jgi:hypothetical protein